MTTVNPAVAAIQEKLAREEAKTVPGAPVLTPKAMMLDASAVEKALGPDTHVRWVNAKDPNKVAVRQMEGYRRVSESEAPEGARVALGDEMVLMATSRERYDARVAAQKEENRRRLKSHKSEMERMADNVARELRDNHGISVDPRRLFTDEGQ